jgi:DNA polymerase-2
LLPAFLLSSRWHDNGDQTLLTFWWSTPEGPVRTTIEQSCICFIARADRAKAELAIHSLGWPITLKDVSLRLFDGRDALACYLPSNRLYRWRDVMRDQGVGIWELDIRPTDRYLMERFVAGGAVLGYESLVDKAPAEINQGAWQDAIGAQIKPGDYRPALSCLSIDIETSYPRLHQPDRLFSIGFYAPDFSLVLMIDEALCDGNNAENLTPEYYEAVADEPALLKRFLDVVAEYDPDLIIGWNFIQFDMAFLKRKFEQHDIDFNLGRNASPIEWRQSQQKPDRIFLHTPGRVILDGIECLRTATWHFDSFALDDVAKVLLGDAKLLHGEERGSDIEHLFEHGKKRLAEYNLKDCELVWRIFIKTDLFEFLIERSQMTGLLMDRMGGSVAAFENMYLPRLHRKGWVAPNLGDGYSAEKSPGGYVMDSIPGLYEHVLVLDFKSLYPSIIRTFCIDPLGLIEGLSAVESLDDTSEEPRTIPGYFGGHFHREHHVLPDLIRHLGELRETAKTEGNTPLSQSIKIIMASCYGILGSDGCRFYDTRLAASITKRGHDIIQRTTGWIQQQGYDVIYGDTDSVFVWLKTDVTDAEADVIGHQLVKDINAWLQDELEREFSLPSYLELEYETHYRRFFMPSIRGAETGSKKRYAGIKAGSEALVFKGLEAVRSDWTPLAREFQKELYRRIFYQEPWQDWLKSEVTALLAGERDHLLIYRKRLRRPLTHYQKSRPPHAKAAAMMDRWLEAQGRSARYQDRGGWVTYLITLNGPEPDNIRHSAIDYGHYLEKQLQPVAEAMFQFTGDSFLNLTSNQHRLF